MNSVKGNNRIREYIVPVLAATAIMVLILLTVPMVGIPATVLGGYGGGGGGGGGGGTPAAPAATTTATIGTVGFTVPAAISMGTPGTITLVISGPDAASVDPLSMTFAGAPVQSAYFDTSGNLVLVFDKSRMNLKPGDTSAMISGKLKDGTPFSGAVLVTVVM